MSLDVKILGLDQKSSADFSDGSITQANFLRIELPSGETILALVDDEVAQKILVAVQATRNVFKERAAPPPVPQATAPSRVAYTARPATPPAFEFGGGMETEETVEDDDEPIVPPQLGPQLTRMRTPAADDAGNPVDATGTPLYENAPEPRAQEEPNIDEDGVRGL